MMLNIVRPGRDATRPPRTASRSWHEPGAAASARVRRAAGREHPGLGGEPGDPSRRPVSDRRRRHAGRGHADRCHGHPGVEATRRAARVARSHAWVMSGFVATADPVRTRCLRVTKAYILDPLPARLEGLGPEPEARSRRPGRDRRPPVRPAPEQRPLERAAVQRGPVGQVRAPRAHGPGAAGHRLSRSRAAPPSPVPAPVPPAPRRSRQRSPCRPRPPFAPALPVPLASPSRARAPARCPPRGPCRDRRPAAPASGPPGGPYPPGRRAAPVSGPPGGPSSGPR